MVAKLLTASWIVPPSTRGPLGFGATAHSLDDAIQIIRDAGYSSYLPDDAGSLRLTEDVRVADLDERHVRCNMGPIVVRGLWYPFVRV